jgi:hypothetical protein
MLGVVMSTTLFGEIVRLHVDAILFAEVRGSGEHSRREVKILNGGRRKTKRSPCVRRGVR